jgi:phage portal protein BeeE
MKAVASVPLVVQQRSGDEWQTVRDHELKDLIERPNPHESMDYIVQMAMAHLNLRGNAAWHVVTAGADQKKPYHLWLLKPSEIKPLASSENFLAGYEVQRAGMTKQRLEAHEVVHWMFPDPDNFYWGMAPLEAASRAVDTDISAVRWNKNIIDNRGVTDTAFMLEGLMTQEQYELAEAQVIKQLNIRNASKILATGKYDIVNVYTSSPLTTGTVSLSINTTTSSFTAPANSQIYLI